MAVKIRLARRGRKHYAYYVIIVADARAPRDGKYLARVGSYDPNKNPALLHLDAEAILDWLNKGAQPTATVRDMLSSQGLFLKRHLQMGIDKGVITQEIANERFAAWEKIAAKKKRKPYAKAVPMRATKGQ